MSWLLRKSLFAMISINDNVKAGTPNTTENLIQIWEERTWQAWVTLFHLFTRMLLLTSKILLSHWGGKCAILWLLSRPIPVFRLLWDFPRFSCEITWLPSTPLLAINKMFEVFARLSSTEGTFQNRHFKIYKSALENHRNRNWIINDTIETQLRQNRNALDSYSRHNLDQSYWAYW